MKDPLNLMALYSLQVSVILRHNQASDLRLVDYNLFDLLRNRTIQVDCVV